MVFDRNAQSVLRLLINLTFSRDHDGLALAVLPSVEININCLKIIVRLNAKCHFKNIVFTFLWINAVVIPV